eukprot:TRINITY_DN19819_c0_g1_i1.p1 TRINITY_DN19819_c0_g1~~TRINITY_DN19819_c0_g1_i1.p1  ORF type:complete len:217 (+),score=57.79 TRINITY_DN19819_c0_g1_i1:398-1048(+)
MEMFNLLHQKLLDDHLSGAINDDEFRHEYSQSKEGFNMQHYGLFPALAKELKNTQIMGGFIPRGIAREMSQEDDREQVLVKHRHVFDPKDYIKGTDFHFNYFSKMMQSFNFNDPDGKKLHRFFNAQILKDSSMAWRIASLLKDLEDDSKIVVICGAAHCRYGLGVPERVRQMSIRPFKETIIECIDETEDYEPLENGTRSADFALIIPTEEEPFAR